MTKLVALLSSGKGTWAQVNSLIKNGKWEHVYLISNEFGYENFTVDNSKVTKLKFDEKKPVETIAKVTDFLKKEIKDFEVALNLSSGTGVEHMAIVSSVLKAGLGIRFVYCDYDEIKEFEILDEKYIENDEE